MGLTPYLAVLKSFELNLRTEKMAACNFRRGLVLFNLQRQMALSQKNATLPTSAIVLGGGHHAPSKYELHGGEKQKMPIGLEIGRREVVGYGNCGQENYIDHVHYPFPAIRFKEDTGEIAKLREKEKGDWKKMTIEEKRVLYRASFCSTLAEVEAPTGEWNSIIGLTLVGISIGV